MPAILIKEIPAELHRKLKKEAARHHRSMTRHALALIEEGLNHTEEIPFPKPEKPRRPFTQALLAKAIKESRA